MAEANKKDINSQYRKAASIINKAGQFPYPVTEALIEILKYNIKEENLKLIWAFKKNISQTMEQLKESSNLSEEEILKKVEVLAKKGVIFNQPNRQGIMVYRLLPIFRQFEYTFMKKIVDTEEFRNLASLYAKLDEEIEELVQANYDGITKSIEKQIPIDRTVLSSYLNKDTGEDIEIIVNKELKVPSEQILPTQKIEEIVNKYEDIAVGNCFCRQHKDMLADPCKTTDIRENCFTLGKSARHTSQHGFSRMVSKEEALEILERTREAGLVHKAYHLHSDINKEEVAICNCCKCCCPNSKISQRIPVVNTCNFLAEINQDLCVGCGTCVEKCHNNAIFLNDDNLAERMEEDCIGCGLCAYFCPENAISMIEGKRIVRLLPPRK